MSEEAFFYLHICRAKAGRLEKPLVVAEVASIQQQHQKKYKCDYCQVKTPLWSNALSVCFRFQLSCFRECMLKLDKWLKGDYKGSSCNWVLAWLSRPRFLDLSSAKGNRNESIAHMRHQPRWMLNRGCSVLRVTRTLKRFSRRYYLETSPQYVHSTPFLLPVSTSRRQTKSFAVHSCGVAPSLSDFFAA